MRYFYILILSTFIISCKSDKINITITHVDNSEIDSLSIRALEVKNEKEIFFAGSKSTFGYTLDGGKSWDLSKLDTLNQEFRSIAVLDGAILLMNVGSPAKVYRSTNLGKTWNVTFIDSAKTAFYNSMKFWDNENGIATGDPQQEGCLSIIRTTDGGKSWSKVACENLTKTKNGEAQFAASNTCIDAIDNNIWIATGGKKSSIIKSDDFGETWSLLKTDFISGKQMTGIFSIDFLDKNNGFIIGGDWENMTNTENNKFFTKDGGQTWNKANSENVGYRSCVQYMPNTNSLVSVGIPGISISLDRGENWKNISDENNFYTLRFIDNNSAWIAGKGKLAKLEF